MTILAAGLLLWAFLLLVPSLYVGVLGPSAHPVTVASVAAPVLVLALGSMIRSDALLLLGFPLLLLPALVTEEALTGPRVYGLDAYCATMLLGALYVATVLQEPGQLRRAAAWLSSIRAFSRRQRLLLLLHGGTSAALLLGAIGVSVFSEATSDALEQTHGAEASSARVMAIAAFLFLWLMVLTRVQLPALRVILEYRPKAFGSLDLELDRFRYDATNERRIRTDLGWALSLGLICSVALALVMMR